MKYFLGEWSYNHLFAALTCS